MKQDSIENPALLNLDSSSRHQEVRVWNQRRWLSESYEIIDEEPLSIRIQGKPYSVVMRTPGDELPHVAGFCLSEGIVDSLDDIGSLGFCDGSDTNVVTVSLSPTRRAKIKNFLDRRGFISQTSCGICGKEVVNDLFQSIRPIKKSPPVDIKSAVTCLDSLANYQPLRKKTRASHAAAIFDERFKLLDSAEDVGRHNALDKAIGKLFLNGSLNRAMLLTLSSRISYELVQKAARAGIPIILAISRPTKLAVMLAEQLNITLACFADDDGILIFTHEYRFEKAKSTPVTQQITP